MRFSNSNTDIVGSFRDSTEQARSNIFRRIGLFIHFFLTLPFQKKYLQMDLCDSTKANSNHPMEGLHRYLYRPHQKEKLLYVT